MRGLFVDTAGWMSLADGRDPRHDASKQTRDGWLKEHGVLISSDYVMDETFTLIRVRLGVEAAARWWDQVESSSFLRWEWMDRERAEKARRWFFRWQDKSFSFTDCTSFVIMRELHLRRVLTADRHFQEAGFEILPK